ncbi:MAG: hypothetical protein ACR2Q4_21765, partial [Geminicoccaceae bacterium]
VLCNPSMLGFGLDEDTAFVAAADGQVSVHGKGTLTIVDGSHLEATDIDYVANTKPAGFTGMRMHVLTPGWTYDLKSRRGTKRPMAAPTADSNAENPEPAFGGG